MPEAEDLLVAAAEARGISITPRDAHRGFMVAGEWWTRQMRGLPLAERTAAERDALYSAFDARVLKAASTQVEAATAREIVDTLMQTDYRPTLAVYPEAAQALTSLQAQGKQLGIISNMGQELPAITGSARPEGLFHLDSRPCGRAGFGKPDPRIFQWAAENAGVASTEAAHVGDQVENDVQGARDAGLLPILVDRYALFDGETAGFIRVDALLAVSDHVLSNLGREPLLIVRQVPSPLDGGKVRMGVKEPSPWLLAWGDPLDSPERRNDAGCSEQPSSIVLSGREAVRGRG